MAEKKGRFIIQEVKERNHAQIFPKRYDSHNILKKVTMKSLGAENGNLNRSMSFVCDFDQGRWVSIAQLWNNTMILHPKAIDMKFKGMRCVLKKPIKEKLFLSSNDDHEDSKSKNETATLTLMNSSLPFPSIEEVDNDQHNPKTTKSRIQFGFEHNSVAFPRTLYRAKTKIFVKSKIKRRKMTPPEPSTMNQLKEEFQKRISNQCLIKMKNKNSFQIGFEPFLSITSHNFSLIQTSINKQTFTNLVICPVIK